MPQKRKNMKAFGRCATSTIAVPSRERERLFIVLTTIALNVVAVAALAFVPASNWRTAVVLNLVDNAILIGWALWRRDAPMGRLIAFGLVVGFVELCTDAWIVDVTRSLDYSMGGGPMIWRSPFWMPFAWEVVAIQFGCVGMRLIERLGSSGAALTGVLGAVNIPYYEEMARRIHWWRYHDTLMVPGTHTPWAIVIAELLIAGFLGHFARWGVNKGFGSALAAGALAGAAIFPAYLLPYWIIGAAWRGQ